MYHALYALTIAVNMELMDIPILGKVYTVERNISSNAQKVQFLFIRCQCFFHAGSQAVHLSCIRTGYFKRKIWHSWVSGAIYGMLSSTNIHVCASVYPLTTFKGNIELAMDAYLPLLLLVLPEKKTKVKQGTHKPSPMFSPWGGLEHPIEASAS